MRTKKKAKRTKLGLELAGAFKEMAAHLRGEIKLPSYVAHHDLFTPKRIKMIRRKVASSTKEFERLFGIPARTMESYEQGRRRPDGDARTAGDQFYCRSRRRDWGSAGEEAWLGQRCDNSPVRMNSHSPSTPAMGTTAPFRSFFGIIAHHKTPGNKTGSFGSASFHGSRA